MTPAPPPPLSPPGLEDLARQYLADQRICADGSPWVMVNMVTSIDGAIAIDGRSGGLGGPADHRIFRILRSLADVILVGAGTVRAERYGPPQLGHELKALRIERGQTPLPRLAVVSSSLDLPADLRLFGDPGLRPLVVTHAGAAGTASAELRAVADLLVAGDGSVDLTEAVAGAARTCTDGPAVVLCEGGPGLNSDMFAADVIDEIDWTISPMVVGGASQRMVDGPGLDVLNFRLDRATPVRDTVFCRYLRDRPQ